MTAPSANPEAMINMLDDLHGHYTALIECLLSAIQAKLETWKLSDEGWGHWAMQPGGEEPSDDYRRGYNAGVESVAGLLDMLLDEQV
jgi:hypothetical protein